MRRSLLLVTALLAALAHPATARADSSPCAVFDATKRTDPLLGQGLSLTTPYTANYVPAGRTPQVDLVVTQPVDGTLTYTVRRRSAVLLSRSMAVPSATTSLALPATSPGAYQVEMTLTRGATRTGTCLRYGVAVAGSTLDLDALPDGRDWGGPAPEREVVLQKALGGGLVRRGVSFAQVLADPSAYDDTFRAAAARAKATGVLFDVQVGQGGPAETAAIRTSAWEDGVRALVARQRGVVPYWEAWNEPNYDYFFKGADPVTYVNKVLKPFSRAVHAADPAAKVVGGSTYGMDLDWWKKFGKAGGFAYLDVVAVHAYQWDSGWESSGILQEFAALKRLKASYGAARKPIWDTESGYRSLAEAGGPWAQADLAARKVLWERSLGVPTQAFLIEGGWEDWCVIDQYRGVKPAAMALDTQTTLLRGRAFVGMVTTRTKGVYAARFGGAYPGDQGIIAVWTDGHGKRLPLATGHSGVDSTGGKLSVSGAMTVNGSVQYLRYTSGRPWL